MKVVLGQVIVISHDDAAERIGDRQLITLNVECGTGRVLCLDWVAVLHEAVVRDGKNRPAERGAMRYRGRVGVNSGLGRCRLFHRTQPAAAALRKPCGQIVDIRQPLENTTDFLVSSWIDLCDGVVNIPSVLPPRVEGYFLVRVVRVQRGDGALQGVITNDRADADLVGKLERVRGREERLVLPDWVSLVVEYHSAAVGPAPGG